MKTGLSQASEKYMLCGMGQGNGELRVLRLPLLPFPLRILDRDLMAIYLAPIICLESSS